MTYVYFFGCKTTKGSTYACAVYTLIIKVVALLAIGIVLQFSDLFEKEITQLCGGRPFTVTKNFYWFAAIHCSVYFLKAALLVYAVKKNSRCLMIPWLSGTIEDFCIKIMFLSLFLNDGGAGHLGLLFVVVSVMYAFIVMLVYEFFCVCSHYHFLSVKAKPVEKKREESTKNK